MVFEPYEPLNPVGHIHELEITLLRTVDEDHPEGPQSVRFRLSVYNQLNQPVDHKHGNLLPHLTPAQVQGLIDFMDTMWAKAEDEVIQRIGGNVK